jgi:hypothetical protein
VGEEGTGEATGKVARRRRLHIGEVFQRERGAGIVE